jgi:hypothetical protein
VSELIKLAFGLAFYAFHLAIWAGTAYVVFWRGESGWWFLLAAFVSLMFSSVKSS